ncbi:hypothetical protein [Streptomyces sp. NBC_00454]|uniref:hypothetical protein n=1 Tax=Streptomyces sp. NBC_00454 TaxID=2975747 RepID=UPI0030E51057
MKLARLGGSVVLLGAAVSAVLASSPAQAAEGEVEIRHGIFMAHGESCGRDSTAPVDVTLNSTAEQVPAPAPEPTTESTTQPTTSLGINPRTGPDTTPDTTPGAAQGPAEPSSVDAGSETTGWVRTETVLLAVGASTAAAAAGLGFAARRRLARRND